MPYIPFICPPWLRTHDDLVEDHAQPPQPSQTYWSLPNLLNTKQTHHTAEREASIKMISHWKKTEKNDIATPATQRFIMSSEFVP